MIYCFQIQLAALYLGHILHFLPFVNGELKLQAGLFENFEGDLHANKFDDVPAEMTVRELTCCVPLRAW